MMELFRTRQRVIWVIAAVVSVTTILYSERSFAVMSIYGSLAGNTTEDVSEKEITGSALHAAGGVFLSKDATLGANGLGLELTYRNIDFNEKGGDETFTYADSAVGFCARIVPEGGFSFAFGRLTHDIKTKYEPESTLGSKTIQDGKLTGNFLSLGLAASFTIFQPYLDFTRYWLPKYRSKADEFVLGLRVHFPAGM
jgi:hypothetical protein